MTCSEYEGLGVVSWKEIDFRIIYTLGLMHSDFEICESWQHDSSMDRFHTRNFHKQNDTRIPLQSLLLSNDVEPYRV